MSETVEQAALREQVRANYAAAATAVTGAGTRAVDVEEVSSTCCGSDSSCCGTAAASESCCGPGQDVAFGAGLYEPNQQGELPESAVLASLGCGNPVAVAELSEGQTVLDLGSGGGIDVLLSAKRVGPTGRAYGVDMTDEMLDLARRNAAEAGVANVEFLKGTIENVPLPDASVDVVISNCVINLSVDKPAVFAEMYRVLRPGGRVGVSDVVSEDTLTPDQRAERGNWVGCIAGALSVTEYERDLAAVGFTDISLTLTHAVADGMHSAIVKAVKQ